MPLGLPAGSLYNSIPDEHQPWGVDTPHNLYPMELHPTQKANGVYRPQRLVNKQAYHGNTMDIFKQYTKPIGAQPTTQ